MIAGLLALMLVSADTTMRFGPPEADTLLVSVAPAVESLPAAIPVAALVPTAIVRPGITADGPRLTWTAVDTTVKKKRPALVEYSDWYGRRLAIHRTLSWAMIPLFAASYYTGERLARDGRINSPYAVRAIHPYAATGAAVVFGVNTFTGVWNLWAGRKDAEGRKRRFAHSILFMIADAGFAYAGSIGEESRENSAIRSRHRTIALSSMGVSYVGMMMMLLGGK
jgi:hypothetical protein